ncbi:hypothetical protein BASA50_007180 [Batrachochytrium salamandrivorans]|uniref:Gamma-soluble NSF attachment protein n=1 Tax=Batrachochytrium salamandrivorans TaxID=1357716 RepID=A0ABQ8F7K6_9FUNG|nr:hypothetical protein BASA62_004187 [Batrachochytrium salamandrivorans]KAH6584412.1 hypothetical protein BASA60_000991 [Batrachochytrium salamandrivorans]KAH6593618.1 hypothetical protein BASA50_007180 [Batrachochytrium salamandrivorans]KAH6603043.1 hypothetical protein BASA61_000504 [Batrachochytrium salamandrivorans]KAJ1328536.1 hypothetical protein BSLG_010268 [Batrachochytrium salamandrivorans]
MGEADDLMKAGAKALTKTSFFGKSKPDYDDALQNFEQAANLYRTQKDYTSSVEALHQVAECHRNLSSMFLAAKALETAANLLSQSSNDPARAGPVYRQASEYFLAQGSPDRAGEMLEKAAKAYESVDAGTAIEYYTESCTLYEEEGRLRFGVDTFKRAVGFCIRSQRFEQAVALSIRLENGYLKIDNQPLFNRQALTNVILQLSVGNEAMAQQRLDESMQKNGRLCQTDEGQVAQDLLTAFQTGDAALFEGLMRSSSIRFLDNDVGKLVKALKIDPSKAPARGGGGNSSQVDAPIPETMETKALQDELEEEGFL